MKSDSLLTYVALSKVRKGLMFQLLDGPRSLTELREYFGIVSSDLIPRIKELENKKLVVRDTSKYCLTSIGIIVARRLQTEDNLTILLEENARFLNEHDMAPIPTNLLCRIYELGKCRLLENTITDIYAVNRELYSNLSRSKFIMGISPVFDADYPEFFLSLARQIPLSIITTEAIINKVEIGNMNTLQSYLECDNAKLYAINNAELLLVVTDAFVSILLSKNGILDASASLMSFENSAINWGLELFEYYKQRSRKIEPNYAHLT